MRASTSDAYRRLPDHPGSYASDSAGWIDKSDLKRVSGVLAKSADVITAARQDLQGPRRAVYCADLTGPEGSGDLSQHSDSQRQGLEERRKRLRSLLRKSDGVAESVQEGCGPDEAAVANDTGNTESIDAYYDPDLQEIGFSTEQYDFASWDKAEECATSDTELHRRREPPRQKTSSAKNFPEDPAAAPANWTGRLDYLINVVTAALALTALICSMLSTSMPRPHGGSTALVADLGGYAKARNENHARFLESPALPRGTQGFDVLSEAYPEPLPAIPESISAMLFFSGPWHFSAPGVHFVTYAGLPQALPTFPADIDNIILLTTPQDEASQVDGWRAHKG